MAAARDVSPVVVTGPQVEAIGVIGSARTDSNAEPQMVDTSLRQTSPSGFQRRIPGGLQRRAISPILQPVGGGQTPRGASWQYQHAGSSAAPLGSDTNAAGVSAQEAPAEAAPSLAPVFQTGNALLDSQNTAFGAFGIQPARPVPRRLPGGTSVETRPGIRNVAGLVVA